MNDFLHRNPQAEAAQRTPSVKVVKPASSKAQDESERTENLEALAFKVPRPFRRRFRQRAAAADLKLNQLLFEAMDAWEEKHGIKD